GHETARGIGGYALGEQAVERERLVIAARKQALDHIAAHIRRGQSFDNKRVQAVESALYPLRQLSAFRCGRVRISWMGKAGAPRWLAVHGKRMGLSMGPNMGSGIGPRIRGRAP